MARIRNLKPDFFTDEDLACIPIEARHFFAGLWCHADRDGRLEYRPQKLKVLIFPYDNVDIIAICARLAEPNIPHRPNKHFIEIYEVGGEKYIQILNLKKHQKFHKDEKSKGFPAPQGAERVPAGCREGASRPGSGNLKSVTETETEGAAQLEEPKTGTSHEPDPDHLNALAQHAFAQVVEHYPESGKQTGIADGQAERVFADEIITADHGPLIQAVKNYAAEVEAEGTPPQYIKRLVNFLRGGYWRNYAEKKPTGHSPPTPDDTWKQVILQDEQAAGTRSRTPPKIAALRKAAG
jgi:hypothetical protein